MNVEQLAQKQKNKIIKLAEKGLAPVDVATAIGLTPAQYAETTTNDEHPFNTIYWTAKVKYITQLHDAALDLIKHGTDESVKLKTIEYLTNEHNKVAEHKRLAVGYTNIKKLYELIRKQKDLNAITLKENGKNVAAPTTQKARRKKAIKILNG